MSDDCTCKRCKAIREDVARRRLLAAPPSAPVMQTGLAAGEISAELAAPVQQTEPIDACKAISKILARALQGNDGAYRTLDGFIRWSVVEKDMHAALRAPVGDIPREPWVLVSERKPGLRAVVLASWAPKHRMAVVKWGGKRWVDQDGYMDRDESFVPPTYWMQLPYLPGSTDSANGRDDAAAMENEKDAARFAWFMGNGAKSAEFMYEYLQGVREHWTLDQWRAAIDAAITQPKPIGDEG